MNRVENRKNVILQGNVEIGENSKIQGDVILGSKEDQALEIGKNSTIRSGTIIYSNVKIGNNFSTGHNVLIRENTKMGDKVLIGTKSTIEGACKLGNGINIQTGVYIPRETILKDKVFLGPCCVLTNDKYMEYGADLEGPLIEEGAKIGANSTILPGVRVGERAIVGAGAVVTEDVDSGTVVAGNPAKKIREV